MIKFYFSIEKKFSIIIVQLNALMIFTSAENDVSIITFLLYIYYIFNSYYFYFFNVGYILECFFFFYIQVHKNSNDITLFIINHNKVGTYYKYTQIQLKYQKFIINTKMSLYFEFIETESSIIKQIKVLFIHSQNINFQYPVKILWFLFLN